MSIILPKKLATTMGIELTYVPSMFDEMYIKTGGKMRGWQNHCSDINDFLRDTLRTYMHQHCEKDVKMYQGFTLDPSVVEVPTKPMRSSRKLMRAVKVLNANAELVGLVPRSLWTRGGGAHLHVGIPYNTREPKHARFNGVMHYMATHNPWISWAFANPLDDSNATQQVDAIIDSSNTKKLHPMHRNSEAVQYYFNACNELKQYQEEVIRMTRDLHKDANHWTRLQRRASHQSDISYYTRSMARCRKNKALFECRMLVEMEEDWNAAHAPKKESPIVALHDTASINVPDSKSRAISRRYKGDNGTFEFRCFMMYEHHSEHKKHIALANEFVRRAIDAVEYDKDVLVVREKIPFLKDMKYSEAKEAFHNMLRELDFDPADFREETVNIALRKRAIRIRRVCV